MEPEHSLQGYTHDPFVQWALHYPALAERVQQTLLVLAAAQEDTSVSGLVAGRDAALTLHMLAREGGFEDTAAFFNVVYDRACRALLAYR